MQLNASAYTRPRTNTNHAQSQQTEGSHEAHEAHEVLNFQDCLGIANKTAAVSGCKLHLNTFKAATAPNAS